MSLIRLHVDEVQHKSDYKVIYESVSYESVDLLIRVYLVRV